MMWDESSGGQSGGYFSYFPTEKYDSFDDLKSFYEISDKILLIGSDVSNSWQGYVEG